MSSFGRFYLGTLMHPEKTFTTLLAQPGKLRHAFGAIGIVMTLYTLVYVNLTIGGGAPSAFTPWLAIPKEQYYFYNRFLLAPSLFAGWLLAAGVIHLTSKAVGGVGSFEDTLCLLAFSISIACLASLLHDLPDTFLGAIGVLDLKAYEVKLNSPTIWRAILWILYVTSAILFIWLFWTAVRVSQRVRRLPAFGIGLLGYAVYQVMFVVFNR
jgi:hypothetical protein